MLLKSIAAIALFLFSSLAFSQTSTHAGNTQKILIVASNLIDMGDPEKDWTKQGNLLLFLTEERLKENGAITINKGNTPDKHDVIIDNRIVSTMFLPSAALVAKEMLILLEKSEKPGKPK